MRQRQKSNQAIHKERKQKDEKLKGKPKIQ
jgi:hypothetical protein